MEPLDDPLSELPEFPLFLTPLKMSPKEGRPDDPPGRYELEPPGRYELEPLGRYEFEPPGRFGRYELEPPGR